jgi:protein Mpv17
MSPVAALRAWAARPSLSRAVATSASLMALGDAASQAIARRRGAAAAAGASAWDRARTARFAAIGGALHGPFFYRGLNWLGSLPLPPAARGSVAKEALARAVVGQMTLFPTFLAALYTTLGLLEGRTLGASLARLRAAFPETFAAGLVWVPVNVVSFSVVPPGARLLWVNCCSLVWNAYLSWASAEAPAPPAAAAGAAAAEKRR